MTRRGCVYESLLWLVTYSCTRHPVHSSARPIVEDDRAYPQASFCPQLIAQIDKLWLRLLVLRYDRTFRTSGSIRVLLSASERSRTLPKTARWTSPAKLQIHLRQQKITEIFFSLLVYSYAAFGRGLNKSGFFSEQTIFQPNRTIRGAMGKKTAACNCVAMNFRFIRSAILIFTSRLASLFAVECVDIPDRTNIMYVYIEIVDARRIYQSNVCRVYIQKNKIDNSHERRGHKYRVG